MLWLDCRSKRRGRQGCRRSTCQVLYGCGTETQRQGWWGAHNSCQICNPWGAEATGVQHWPHSTEFTKPWFVGYLFQIFKYLIGWDVVLGCERSCYICQFQRELMLYDEWSCSTYLQQAAHIAVLSLPSVQAQFRHQTQLKGQHQIIGSEQTSLGKKGVAFSGNSARRCRKDMQFNGLLGPSIMLLSNTYSHPIFSMRCVERGKLAHYTTISLAWYTWIR